MVLERSGVNYQHQINQLREALAIISQRLAELEQHPLEVSKNYPAKDSSHAIPEETASGLALITQGNGFVEFDNVAAEDVTVDASSFTGNLSGTDTDVQTALGTIDGMAVGAGDKISEGNSSVEVIDSGTGYILFTVDASEVLRLIFGGFADTNGNLWFRHSYVTSAVNYLEVVNAATTDPPELQAQGSDTNIGLILTSKGTGDVLLQVGGTSKLQVGSSESAFLSSSLNVEGNIKVNGTQVITDQQSAVANVSVSGSAEDGTCRSKVNEILGVLRTHGLLAT